MDKSLTIPSNTLTKLQNFVLDNADLERLEDLLSEVNLFEAIGAVRSEMRHSDFFAYLLNPAQNHGLGDLFLKRFLQHAISEADTNVGAISPITLDIWDLDDTQVWRERNNIDILLSSERNKLVICIENKIGTTEHSDQLRKYRDQIEKEFPEYIKLWFFLTLEGDVPSDSNYILVRYQMIQGILEKLIETREASLGPDVLVLLRHYRNLLGRHFMEDSELIQLAKQLYEKHRVALDFIFEHRPDVQSEIFDSVMSRIKESEGLIADHCTKAFIRFVPMVWDEIESMKGNSKEWTPTGRILLFEFRNYEKLQLALVIGPGEQNVRQKIFEYASVNRKIFKPSSKKLTPKWAQIWEKTILTKKEMEDDGWNFNREKVEKSWNAFLENELPSIREAILESLQTKIG